MSYYPAMKKEICRIINKLWKTNFKNSKYKYFIKNEREIEKFLKKNLMNKEIVVGMGAGSISKWMRDLKDKL